MVEFARQSWMAGYRPTWNTATGQYEWNNTSRGIQGAPAADAGPPGVATLHPGILSPEAPPGTNPPPAPVSPSTYDLVLQDPEWLARVGQFAAQRAALVTQYGSGGGLPGVDAATAAAAAANPHSTLVQLGQQRQANDQAISNALQAHHASLGGAAQQSHINEATADETRRAAALQNLQNSLQGVANTQDQLYWDIYHRIAANPPTVTGAPGNPATAGPALPGSLPRPGNTSTAGGVRTIGDQPYIVFNPNLPDTEKRPYSPHPATTFTKPKRPARPRTPGSGL
jgi:hypothetical protein